MAGESPDRSKQRESSEEPTSGSAGPVPGARGETGAGARDPRLAVARDRESTARGGVDTATRVFQRPPLPAEAADADAAPEAEADDDASTADTAAEAASEPEAAAGADSADGPGDGTDGTGSTRLRAAVAAWVAGPDEGERGAGNRGEGESEGVEGAAEDRGPDTDEDTDPDAEAPADAPEGAEKPAPDATDDPGPDEPSEAAQGASEATGGASGDPGKDSSEPESAPESKSNPEPKSDASIESAAEPKSGADSGTGTESGTRSAAEPKPGADSGTWTGNAAEPKSGASTGSGGEPKSESGTESGTGTRSAAEPKSGASTGTWAEKAAEPKSDSGAETGVEPEAGNDSGTRSAAESAPALKSATGTKSGAEPEFGTGTGTQADSGTKAESSSGSKSGTGTEPGAASKPGTGTESGTGTRSAVESKSTTGIESGGAAKPVTATGIAPEVEPKSETESGSEAKPEAEPGTEATSGSGTEAAAESGSGAGGGAASGAKAASEVQSASGSRPESEVRAEGGAAPAPVTGADADDPASRRPVDQPTAVFKAVRPPAAPPVDQPTTMLKLGDLAAAKAKGDAGAEGDKRDADAKADAEVDVKGESVSERTSKFVALRQLDDPATRKPPPVVPPAAGSPEAPAAEPSATPPKVAAAEATAVVPQVGPERTTQQPLPPMPPLDLLAELTNTPPPRDTAVRTIVRRVKIWTPVVILLAIVFAVVQSFRSLPAPELTLTAKDSYTFDGKAAALPWPTEGQGWMDVNGIGTMGNFGEQKPVAIGSVAKAMTAYIVLKSHPLKAGEEGPKIKIDATAEEEGGYYKQDESTLNTVKQGDVLTLKQALSAVMIPSANNIARLLARWDAGTEAAFIKKMNDTAKELGMKNTVYTDASGLKETTVSTAEDQVKLGNELVQIPALMDITKQPSWVDPSGQKWRNYNDLVPYNGAIGIKTGTTTAAGGNLLFAGTKEVGGETVTVVGAILGQHTPPIIDTVNNVSRTALIGAREELLSSKILKKGDVVGYVDDGLGGQTPVVLSKDVTAVGWAGRKVELSFVAADDLPHSAKAGTTVGSLTVGDGKGGAVKVPVQLQKDLVEPGFDKKLTRVG
ncbi:D-alanyl-D-alanine carboxypeptidase [Streptomyces lacrimifluminis]|uniref:serine-type D-Ala-D-Ala carboxypeptidase n=1 Tax=Streptomyces lacrimifluminis TaxID=1500077 RepID=A0A917KHV3_9ACTN|nr:D-alanyl-D-alanine carboxypeptidase [Streptomyces lacrimifluminis]GGJ10447.1 D-alanyl-D-alanine carboxypeptidase [Streptomyces lacrimifluminis]